MYDPVEMRTSVVPPKTNTGVFLTNNTVRTKMYGDTDKNIIQAHKTLFQEFLGTEAC